MRFSFKNLKKSLVKYSVKINKTSVIAMSIGILFLLATLSLLPSTLSNTVAGDDMVFEKSYPDLTTLLSSPIDNYIHWTARLANIFTLNIIFGSTPDSITHLVALPLSLTLLGASTWYLFASLYKLLKIRSSAALGFVTSQALTLILCLFSFSTYDNFYWIAGVVTYMFPVAIFNLVLGYSFTLLHKHQRSPHLPVGGIVVICITSLIAGLYNEGYIVQIITILILVTPLIAYVSKGLLRKHSYILTGAIMLGLITAALIMKFAPGTLYREQLNSSLQLLADYSLPSLLTMTFHTTLDELKTFFIYNKYGVPLIIAVVLVISILAKRVHISQRGRFAVLILSLLTPIVGFSSLAFAVHYAHQPSITNYSLITAYYLAYLGIIGFFFMLFQVLFYSNSNSGLYKRRASIIVGGVILILFLGIFAVQRVYQIYTLIGLQKAEFTKTESLIVDAKSRGESAITLTESVRYFTYCAPEIDKTTWCNNAYSQYYDLESITTKSYKNVESQINYEEGKI